jgi:solute carrier family 13 (sodium-dependent dicarboxylate transporter), member 2/3/5
VRETPAAGLTWIKRALLLAGASLGALAAAGGALAAGLPREAAFMAGIFVLAALLWMTEALPLFATAPAGGRAADGAARQPRRLDGPRLRDRPLAGLPHLLAAAADPVLVLFFGGLPAGAGRGQGGRGPLDVGAAAEALRRTAAAVLAGVMTVCALFSMFMSNTATSSDDARAGRADARRSCRAGSRFRRALVLGVAFAANIGGMGTPIGSPPNAVALGYLRSGLARRPFSTGC